MSDSGDRITFTVNGVERGIATSPARPVLDVLREDLGLTGTKEGCSVGVCGACSVLIDGKLMSACLVPVGRSRARGHDRGGPGATRTAQLSPVQQAFLTAAASSAGSARRARRGRERAARRVPAPSRGRRSRDWMMGNLCRCTGYYSIVSAVLEAAAAGREERA